MLLKIHFDRLKEIALNIERLSEIVDQIIKKENYKIGKIEVIITSDSILKRMNENYMGRDGLTDIIAFTNTKKEKVSGELYISQERIIENSKIFSEGNIKLELYRVIIHGILHLVGYNDFTVKEKAQMTVLEDYYLKKLNLRIDREALNH